MLTNYLKVAWRMGRRQAGCTFVGGLSLGLAACLVIGLFVQYKLSYDRHLPASDRVYRLTALEAIWKDFVPDRPFQFEFLDERIQVHYLAEQRLARIFGLFSGLAILIACLGLFGLATFTAASRTKEIGIRKVLGANVSSIMLMLSRDFLRLIVLAVVVVVPLGWWVMSGWLDTFAYHIQTPWGTFALLAGVALMLALGAVSYQSVRAALADPVKSLRYA